MAAGVGARVRPVVLIYTAVEIMITILFRADGTTRPAPTRPTSGHDGVRGVRGDDIRAPSSRLRAVIGFGFVTLIFAYALSRCDRENPTERQSHSRSSPDHRDLYRPPIARTTELRADRIEFDEARTADGRGQCRRRGAAHRANKRQAGDLAEYRDKESEQRHLNPIPKHARILFLEVDVTDPSTSPGCSTSGVEIDGPRSCARKPPPSPTPSPPYAPAPRRHRPPSALYFQWSEGNPLAHLLRYGPVLAEGNRAGDP